MTMNGKIKFAGVPVLHTRSVDQLPNARQLMREGGTAFRAFTEEILRKYDDKPQEWWIAYESNGIVFVQHQAPIELTVWAFTLAEMWPNGVKPLTRSFWESKIPVVLEVKFESVGFVMSLERLGNNP